MSAGPDAALGNLFGGIDRAATDERFDQLLAQRGVLIERIVSTGQASPEGFWYDDPRDEWVLLLAGSAALQFEKESPARRQLLPGDYVHIPAHCRHRVAWTDPNVATVWLAVYIDDNRA
jgi:cupin 2 domain-containing protein